MSGSDGRAPGSEDLRRNSAKMLVIRLLEVAKFYLPILLLWESTRSRLDGGLGWAASVLFGIYTVTRVHTVVFEWWSTRFAITDAGIRLRVGLLVTQDTFVAWRDAASVTVSRPLLHRWLRCALVRIGTGSQGTQLLTLAAVPTTVAEQIEAFARPYGGLTLPPTTTSAAPGTEGSPPVVPEVTLPASAVRLVYAMTPLDYLIVSITYGQFALVVPFALTAYAEGVRWLRLPTPDLVGVFRGFSVGSVAVIVLLTVLAALVYGYAIAWLRYRDFTVSVQGGHLLVRGGWVSKETRQVSGRQISGLKFEQNPLMRLTGYGKLSVVSPEVGQRVGGNVVFPAVKLARLKKGVGEYFPEFIGLTGDRPARHPAANLLILGSCVTVAGVGWVIAYLWWPDLTVVSGLMAGLCALLVANRLWSSTNVDPRRGSIRYRRGLVWVKQYELAPSAVHVAERRSGPVARQLGLSNLSLTVYDGRRVSLRATASPTQLVDRVRSAVVAAVPHSAARASSASAMV